MSDKDKFKLLIRPTYFAPILSEFNRPVHSVAYGKCNFRCAFCPFGKWQVDRFPEFTLESFEQTLWELLKYSTSFKFTGGEPTLNPYLPDLLRIVKIYSATVYLDTNGSRPDIIKTLLDENLVDVLGISLKGLSSEDAAHTARITNRKLCWDNVFESVRLGSMKENVRVILTYVACDGRFNEESLESLAENLSDYPDVILKINNCRYGDTNQFGYRGFEKNDIYSMLKRFVELHPEFEAPERGLFYTPQVLFFFSGFFS